MAELADVKPVGVAPGWKKRAAVIKALRSMNVRSSDRIVQYNNRLDEKNTMNLVPSVFYSGLGRDLQFGAIASALAGETWLPELSRSVAYRLFAAKLDYFWHENFRVIYQDQGRVLNMFNAGSASVDMAFAFLLGWNDAAIYQGYLIHSILNRKHYLILPYEEEHQRAQAFMLRLFADWRGDVSHSWPAYAYDEPIYNGLLERWRDPDPSELLPWLVAACDRHTHEAALETAKATFDFCDATLTRTPVEILMVFRLREILGMKNPKIDHPLMEPPFDKLPEAQPILKADAFVEGTLQRVRTDWPTFDEVTAIETIRSNQTA